MRTGLGALGWSPDQFWNATLAEVIAASDGLAIFNGQEDLDDPGFGVAELRELMARYPDKPKNGNG